ncbi:tumor necrosis factor receptor superfamily member 1A [Hoplias malabaricus]|uniref:tumor necrosis factor receptor superfamily member 1A n=1 Tax=Hoplias malabaricus TaxID=27720 RepID=UPI003463357F
MDTGHSRGKWRKKCLPYILFLMTLLMQQGTTAEPEKVFGRNASQISCKDDEYMSKNGICCDKCSPGFKLIKECSAVGLRSQCEKCSDGTYQDNINFHPNCFKCNECVKNEKQISPCTHKTNSVCVCKEGYYTKHIDMETRFCERCKKCGVGERNITKCVADKNTECVCRDLHYRVNKTACVPCKYCGEHCEDMCNPPSTDPGEVFRPPQDPTLPGVLIPLLGTTTVLALVILVVYVGITRCRKNRRNVGNQSESHDPENETSKQVYCPETTMVKIEEYTPLALASHWRESELPDCVPKEIKTHEFIYFALEVVPVKRFRELARRLNVSEQDIDRAEHDNRTFIEAQYQMLKVWSDSGTGAGKHILPLPLIQEFVDRLRDMNLNNCAESIESKYSPET